VKFTLAEKAPTATVEPLSLPEPDPGVNQIEFTFTTTQLPFFDHDARFKVMAKGRRFGATMSCAQYIMREMLSSKQRVLWIDVIYSNISRYYQRCFSPTLNKIPHKAWEWREQQKQLSMANGSYMDMRSADRPESIEGFGYSLIVINEAGIVLQDRNLWQVSIAPMALDYNARVLFVGTPKGRRDKKTGEDSLYYELYKKGLDPKEVLWKSFTFSTYDNPLFTKAAIDELISEIPPIIRRQEIFAEFIDIGEDQVFYSDWFPVVDALPTDSAFFVKVMSLDTAFKTKEESDYSACVVIYQTLTDFYVVDVVNDKFEFPELLTEVDAIYNRHHVDAVLVEDRASGQSLIQSLKANTAFPVRPISPDKDKITRASAVTPLCSTKKVKLLKAGWNKMFLDQLQNFPCGHDDICFVAGTLIATMSGDRPIESIKIGDSVITPIGVRKVTKTFEHYADRVINKMGLTCTPNHPVFANNEFIRIDALTQTMNCSILDAWTLTKWSLKDALNSMGSFTTNLVGKPLITTIARIIRPKKGNPVTGLLKLCIESFGKNTTVTKKFLLGLKFITKIITGTTTTLAIYSCYRCGNIVRSIGANLVQRLKSLTLLISGLLPLNGIDLKRAERGIGNMPLDPKKNEMNRPAFNVGMFFYLVSPQPNSAAIIAMSNGGLNTIPEWFQKFVLSAKALLKHMTGVRKPQTSAPDPVVSETIGQPVRVFNLEIDHVNCYYANGILVGNCDALSQALTYLKDFRGVKPGLVTRTLKPDVIPGFRGSSLPLSDKLSGYNATPNSMRGYR
jgi:predicted phage terminase large subunit-like protein